MVNLVPSTSTPASAIQQHSGLPTATAAEDSNDEPPPIPQPPIGPSGPMGGGRRDAKDANQQDAAHQHNVVVHDYGNPGPNTTRGDATAGCATPDDENAPTLTPGTPLASAQSSLTAVSMNDGDTVIEFGDASEPHTKEPAAIAAALGVELVAGLTTEQAKARLEEEGPNTLSTGDGIKWYTVLGRQVSNSLTLVLVIAMAASYGMLDYIEGSVIAAVILLNIIIGFIQDFRAERTMQSLNSLSAPEASVIRDDGHISKLKAEELVRGDIVRINVGDVVPADLRVFEAVNLETNEALLTGESLPIGKNAADIIKDVDAPIGDRFNMVWASSTVSKGRGIGIVTATGMQSEVGKIAELLRGKKAVEGTRWEKMVAKAKSTGKNVLGLVGTPLQIKLSKFALLLFALAILLAIIVFSAAKWRINGENLIYGICVAVAVIPESLIAVLTITMAVGTKSMARGNVIVRKMQALEAVGGVTNICSDKTGTLTQGKMVARKAFIPGLGELHVDGVKGPFDPTSGQVMMGMDVVDGELVTRSKELERFLEGIAMCNLSSVHRSDSTNGSSEKPTEEWTATGEPTEISLQVFAMRFGHGKQELLASGDWDMLAEHPFDSTVKKMSVVYANAARNTTEVFMKGAGEVVIPTLNISSARKAELLEKVESLASSGLRVLCVAHKTIESENTADRATVEANMDLLGLIGLYDPPRLETKDAVRKCRLAGIAVHMLTGDHISTATAIAHETGILTAAMPTSSAGSMVMSATDFDALSDAQLDALPRLPYVLARCSPATKVRMVEALHRRGAFCVMTGDGVNDSPALKRADVGIAMGLSGSDVAKDAADLVLTDDNFASIVRAVEEGRRLFDNIQKFIMHLLISNISQVVLLLIGLAFQDRAGVSVFPLSPLEILWVNMITSSFLALGLGLEAAAPDVMTRPPHDLRAGVFTWEVIIDKTLYGVTMGVLCLASFIIVIFAGNNGELGEGCNHSYNDSCEPVFRARATVFCVLSFLLLLTAWEVKHFTRSLFRMHPERWSGPTAVFKTCYENKFLFWAVVGGAVITFPVVYTGGVNRVVFKHTAITWEWGVVLGAMVVYLGVVEGWKAIKRWRGWGSAGVKRRVDVEERGLDTDAVVIEAVEVQNVSDGKAKGRDYA